MRLVPGNDRTEGADLAVAPLHLGPDGSASHLEDFGWDPDAMAEYESATADQGADGRLVVMFDHEPGDGDPQWESHPIGDEVVICVSGEMTLVQRLDDGQREIHLAPGEAAINPAGTWHTIVSRRGGRLMTITPGLGTEHASG